MAELEFKYLNEIDISDSLTDAAHVIVEDGGNIRRAPMNQLVTGSGVSSWNDLTDRPFYEENNQTVIEWDGNTEGRDVLYLGQNMPYFKVSDIVPTFAELIGATVGVLYAGEQNGGATTEDMLLEGYNCVFESMNWSFFIAQQTECALPQGSVQVPSVGTYFGFIDSANYTSSLAFNRTVAHKIDPKFIPDTIARTSDIPEVPEVTIDNNGQVLTVVDGVWSTSERIRPNWNQSDPTDPNYIENRTHWLERDGIQIYNFTDELNVDKGNGIYGSNATAISYSSPKITAGETYTVVFERTSYVCTCTERMGGIAGTTKYLELGTTGLIENPSSAIPFCIQYSDDYDTVDDEAWGRYIVAKISEPKTVNIEIYQGGSSFFPLDEAFIPDTIARTADIPEVNYPVTSVNGMTGDVVIEGGSGGGGVSSWNDLTDRPFYEENNQTIIEWDGNTEGLEPLNGLYYKVSDLTPSYEELVGCTMKTTVLESDGQWVDESVGENFREVQEVTSGALQIGSLAYVINVSGEDRETSSLPANGTYFYGVFADDMTTYVKSLTYGSTTIHTLDEKFIPDTIARTADIPEVNYPVTSVNGMTGDVVIEGGSGGGGVTSWNDLEDRPFYEEGSGATIEWDGNTEGRDSFEVDGAIYYKVSDKVASYDDLIGGEFSITEQQELFNGTLSEGDIEEGTNCYFFADGGMAIVLQPEFEIAGITLSAPSSGIYFGYFNPVTYATKLSYGNLTIHKLDPKFLSKPEDFLIESVVNLNSSEATLDRSFEEILDAYQSGKNILFKFKNSDTTYFYLKPAIQYICHNGQIVEFIFTVLSYGNLDTIGEYVIGLDANDGSTYVKFNAVYAENGEPRIIAISDVTAAPTMEDFNALLAALRASGLMAT